MKRSGVWPYLRRNCKACTSMAWCWDVCLCAGSTFLDRFGSTCRSECTWCFWERGSSSGDASTCPCGRNSFHKWDTSPKGWPNGLARVKYDHFQKLVNFTKKECLDFKKSLSQYLSCLKHVSDVNKVSGPRESKSSLLRKGQICCVIDLPWRQSNLYLPSMSKITMD